MKTLLSAKTIVFAFVLGLIALSQPALAADGFLVNEAISAAESGAFSGSAAGGGFGNSQVQIIQKWAKLVVNLAYFAGAVLVAIGLWGFKKTGENPNQYPLAANLSKLVAGLLLLSLTSFYVAVSGTFTPEATSVGSAKSILEVNPHIQGLQSTPLGNGTHTGFARFLPTAAGETFAAYIWFVGLIAFVRGVFSLKDLGYANQYGSNKGSGAKSATFIVSGWILMNFIMVAGWIGIWG